MLIFVNYSSLLNRRTFHTVTTEDLQRLLPSDQDLWHRWELLASSTTKTKKSHDAINS